MGASLACAASAAGEADGYLVALADMPFVRRTTIAAVRDALAAGAPLAAPYFPRAAATPLRCQKFREQLFALKGDAGAKKLSRTMRHTGQNPGRRPGRDSGHRYARGSLATA